MSPSSHFYKKKVASAAKPFLSSATQLTLRFCNVLLFMTLNVWMWFSKMYLLWKKRAGHHVCILVETQDKNMKIRKKIPLGKPKSRDLIISSFCSEKPCQNANFWVKCAVEERWPKGNDLKATASMNHCQFVLHVANVSWGGKNKSWEWR